MKKGILYGVGIGPGDPELITLKAVNIIRRVDVIFAPSSSKNTYSLALDIVAPYLRKDVEVIKLSFPMTKQKNILEDAWTKNAKTIMSYINNGKNGAFITLGDPLTYSTFGYIKRIIRKSYPDTVIKIVPGITSYHAAAAVSGRILAESEESFVVMSGAMGAKKLKEIIEHVDHAVMLKVYRKYREIIETISELGLTEDCVLVSKCGLEGEEIIENLRKIKQTPPYLSLLIIDKKRKR